MQLLRAVLVTTSIADWTPSLDPIRATLQSLECLDAADATAQTPVHRDAHVRGHRLFRSKESALRTGFSGLGSGSGRVMRHTSKL